MQVRTGLILQLQGESVIEPIDKIKLLSNEIFLKSRKNLMSNKYNTSIICLKPRKVTKNYFLGRILPGILIPSLEFRNLFD